MEIRASWFLCSLAGIDGSGQVVVRRRVRRENVFKIVSQLKPGTVAMEACGGAHHLGRLLRDAGFEVRLMSPEYVRPYVKAQKNATCRCFTVPATGLSQSAPR